MNKTGLKCTVSIGDMQIKNLLNKFTTTNKIKTTKKGLPSLDSMAKARQKESAARGAQHAEAARLKREEKKRLEAEQQA